jgi:hypothetical protein
MHRVYALGKRGRVHGKRAHVDAVGGDFPTGRNGNG